jgi:hypothetical protein
LAPSGSAPLEEAGFVTTDWIRETSNIDFAELGYPAPDPGGKDRLRWPLEEALVEFRGLTGIDVTSMTLDADDPTYDKRVPLLRRAIRMLVEYAATSSQMEQTETASDYDMLSSFSASGYSESRRGIARPNPQVLHPWPALNRLLNQILYFDDQGNVRDTGPGVVASGDPRPYEDTMRQRAVAHGLHFGIGPVVGPVWPRGGGC